VRALVRDDPRQAALADDLLLNPCIITASVVMEIEWVLRSRYSWSRPAIARGLRELTDLPALVQLPGVEWAIDRLAAGADLADMIHLISARPAERFATFDRRLARKAGAQPPLPIETLA